MVQSQGLMKSDLFFARCCKSFSFFRKHLLGRKHARMYDLIVDAILSPLNKNVLVLAHRGSGKSTLVSVDFPLWLCFRTWDKKLTITVSSASLEQSRLLVEEMQRIISSNEYLNEVLLPEKLHDLKWNAQRLSTKNGHRIFCITFGSTARGKTADYSILDDVLKLGDANVDFAKKTFWADVFPITRSKGKHLVVGTPIFWNDLLNDLKVNELFTCLEFPALVKGEDGLEVPQCPELFSLEKLLEFRNNMPRHQWMREYMLVPMSEGDLLFPHEIVLPCVVSKPLEVSKDFVPVYYCGLDVAMSTAKDADASVFTVGRVLEDGLFEVVLVEARKGWSSKMQLDRLCELHSQFNFRRIVIEDNGVGQGLASDAVNDERIKHVVRTFRTSRASKERILGELELAFRKRTIRVPDDSELLKELTMFGLRKSGDKYTWESLGGKDDRVMSLAMLVDLVSSCKSSASISFV